MPSDGGWLLLLLLVRRLSLVSALVVAALVVALVVSPVVPPVVPPVGPLLVVSSVVSLLVRSLRLVVVVLVPQIEHEHMVYSLVTIPMLHTPPLPLLLLVILLLVMLHDGVNRRNGQ